MFIDTHCHLTDRYTDGIENVISRATDASVGIMICPTANPEDIESALDIANKYDNIFC
jgi:Tat protein secretion system quality control protein TatD with DNase activity